MVGKKLPVEGHGEFLIYTTPDGDKQIQVRLIDETIWLSQKMMSELFQKNVRTISEHINNIFAEDELAQDFSTVRKFRIVQKEGEREVEREVDFYNLDVIISVGYRVKSLRGTQFRQWATQRIKEYLIKGFTINKEYLKDPQGKDYFDELLKAIREIRASEKRFYLKVRDIYATSVDYDSNSDISREFFAIVQNKMLWAVTGKTAGELIDTRADADKQNMGLTTWEKQRILSADVVIAKNYLLNDEIERLERLVSMFLEYAELQAFNRKPMYMTDWVKRLDGILSLNEMEILTHAGKISKELADKKTKIEYKKYDEKSKAQELLVADEQFIEEIKKLEKLPRKKETE